MCEEVCPALQQGFRRIVQAHSAGTAARSSYSGIWQQDSKAVMARHFLLLALLAALVRLAHIPHCVLMFLMMACSAQKSCSPLPWTPRPLGQSCAVIGSQVGSVLTNMCLQLQACTCMAAEKDVTSLQIGVKVRVDASRVHGAMAIGAAVRMSAYRCDACCRTHVAVVLPTCSLTQDWAAPPVQHVSCLAV